MHIDRKNEPRRDNNKNPDKNCPTDNRNDIQDDPRPKRDNNNSNPPQNCDVTRH